MAGLGERKNLQYHHWSEYKMRFEDIKIRPGEILRGVCKKLDIKWSDNMLRTTDYGKPLTYRGSVDFDLKSVFNKYEEYLSNFLSELLERDVTVKLIHDGQAAALSVAGEKNSVLVALGTAFGVGFPPESDEGLRPAENLIISG